MNLNEYKVLNILNKIREPVFFRELVKLSEVSVGGTQQVIRNYFKFIDKQVRGRHTYYSFKDDVQVSYLRKIIEIVSAQNFLFKNPLFSDFFNYFTKKDIPCIIFGSYAKGRAVKGSDVDMLVLSTEKLPEHLCPVETHTIRLSQSQFEKAVKKRETLINEISDNHIIIERFDYFTRWLNEKS